MELIERIHDVSTGKIVERPYTQEQIDESNAALARFEIEAQEANAKEALRQSAMSKLGLTPEEIAAILS